MRVIMFLLVALLLVSSAFSFATLGSSAVFTQKSLTRIPKTMTSSTLRPASFWGGPPPPSSPTRLFYYSSSHTLEEEALNHRSFLTARHNRLHSPPTTLSPTSLLSSVTHLPIGRDVDLLYHLGFSPQMSPTLPQASKAVLEETREIVSAMRKHVLTNPKVMRFVPIVKKFVLPSLDTKTLFAFWRVGTFLLKLVSGPV